MLTLPNGCRCSELSVFPSNWNKPTASVVKDWRIQYYFYEENNSKGHLKIVKAGINKLKTRQDRKEATIALIAETKQVLLDGFNPVKNKFISDERPPEITEYSRINEALEFAYNELKISKETKVCIRSCVSRLQKTIIDLRFHHLILKEVRTKHVRRILNTCVEKYNLSASSFNHYRSYSIMLFKILLEMDAVDYNPAQNISKQQGLKKIKRLLNPDERKKISDHFKSTNIYYYRFIHCFFHSGARPIELIELKKQDVDISNLCYKVTVRKGKLFEEQMRPIKEIAVEFWQAQLNECGNDHYIFGSRLKPGSKKGTRDYITKKWQREVKKHMKIDADFYSLKHLNLDETAELLSAEDASTMAGHTSTVITMKHYLINEKKRQLQRLKKVNNSFA